jgi:hypothetical protein
MNAPIQIEPMMESVKVATTSKPVGPNWKYANAEKSMPAQAVVIVAGQEQCDTHGVSAVVAVNGMLVTNYKLLVLRSVGLLIVARLSRVIRNNIRNEAKHPNPKPTTRNRQTVPSFESTQ